MGLQMPAKDAAPDAYDCKQGIPANWSPDQQAWCCKNRGAGCNQAASGTAHISNCEGDEKEWLQCDELPACNDCHPLDCGFSEWGDWTPLGGCSGLCSRERGIMVKNNECGKPCLGATQETAQRDGCLESTCTSAEDRDCAWDQWSQWSECSLGGGQSVRFRKVAQLPLLGGQACEGSWNATRPCKLPDAQDCVLSEWGEWTACSVTCDSGYKAQMRRVMREAERGGSPCEGSTRRTAPCGDAACDGDSANCVMGPWGEWSACEYGSAQRYRERAMMEPPRGNGFCSDGTYETEGCSEDLHKAAPCEVGEWSEWSACSATCGGQKFRLRNVAQGAEKTCYVTGDMTDMRETAACGTDVCVMEDGCELSSWSEWSECSEACGPGTNTRQRRLVSSPRGTCKAALEEAGPCNSGNCDVKDCLWASWELWGGCSQTCGGGVKRRSRTLMQSPRHGGQMCIPQDKSEVAECNVQSCGGCVDGSWGEWGEWSGCSATCGNSFKVRHRDVDQRANDCGTPAVGLEDEYARCEADACGVPTADCQVSQWGEWSDCTCSCFGVRERNRQVVNEAVGMGAQCRHVSLSDVVPCNPGLTEDAPSSCAFLTRPTNCELSPWEPWQVCTRSCGGGQSTRYRRVLVPARHGGLPCDAELAEVASCNEAPCSEDGCVDCIWDLWQEWGACSDNDGGGQRTRHRAIKQHSNKCGKICVPGAAKEVAPCAAQGSELMSCTWTGWSELTPCSQDCGPATRMRQRHLELQQGVLGDALFPATRNTPCSGSQVTVEKCAYVPCHGVEDVLDCEFGSWGEWSGATCTQLCERRRDIQRKATKGGRPCDGPLTETKRCQGECSQPEDCLLSAWSGWTGCGRPEEQKYRKRYIAQQAANRGKTCTGPLRETHPCNPKNDLSSAGVDCVLTDWQAWSECSCQGPGCTGYRTREREVFVAAEGAGRPCMTSLKTMAPCQAGGTTPEDEDCGFSQWSTWSDCSLDGLRSRMRRIEQQASGGGMTCLGPMREVGHCAQAPSVDCKTSDWTSWDACDRSCGGGQQQRHRLVTTNPRGDGAVCPEDLMEVRGCAQFPCGTVDVDLSDWEAWGACSASCGAGQKSRQRSIKSLPEKGGSGFNGLLVDAEPCYGADSEACNTCQDCVWAVWSEWGACSRKCGGGQRVRGRHVEQPPLKGCKPCDPLHKEEVDACNMHSCGQDCEDEAWGEWAEWAQCSASCQGGMKARTRTLAKQGNACGQPATGPSIEHSPCNDQVSCMVSVDCSFSAWGGFGDCTSSCGGVKTRERAIAVHGAGGGAVCDGPLKQTVPCQPGAGCAGEAEAVDCELATWSKWGACDATCGTGQMVRFRQTLVEARGGGRPCGEVLTETAPCAQDPCNQVCEASDCRWAAWSDWSACERCGGQIRRSRHVEAMPQCGGAACEPGAAEEVARCERNCHSDLVYCEWGEWSDYGGCSATCGSAVKSRMRSLRLVEAPETVRRLVGPNGTTWSGMLDAGALEEKYLGLELATRRLQTRRFQTLVVAWAAGAVSLLVLVALNRFRTRSGGDRETYSVLNRVAASHN